MSNILLFRFLSSIYGNNNLVPWDWSKAHVTSEMKIVKHENKIFLNSNAKRMCDIYHGIIIRINKRYI